MFEYENCFETDLFNVRYELAKSRILDTHLEDGD